MCAIAGYITTKKHSKTAINIFLNILEASETRGIDASGISFVADNKIIYQKAPKRAGKMKNEYKKTLLKYNPNIVIGHTRQKTQGNENNNNNNHPILTDTGLSMVHNGIISNDDDIFEKYKLERKAEVDSEAIIKLIEYFHIYKNKKLDESITEASGKLSGSMACALLSFNQPRSLYLWARTSPLILAYHKPTKSIFFFSTEAILENSLKSYRSYFNGLFINEIVKSKNDFILYEAEDLTGYKITPKTWSSFDIEKSYTKPYITKNKYNSRFWSNTPSKKPLAIEKKTTHDIFNELKNQLVGFNENETIKQPGKYLSELILLRLENIQLMQAKKMTATELQSVEGEVKRLINALKHRQKITNRKIVVPKPKNVIQSIHTNNPQKIKWVLADNNEPLYKSVLLADKNDTQYTLD